MVGRRHKDLIKSRRRISEEGEDEASVVGVADDSQSEASNLSDVEKDGDADDSDLSGHEGTERSESPQQQRSNGRGKRANGHTHKPAAVEASTRAFGNAADTEAMMNGLKISADVKEEEAADFEDMGKEVIPSGPTIAVGATQVGGPKQDTIAERRRKEFEEYKKKRDSDPAFVPNRGGFFMHDQRSAPGTNGFRPFGRGRGRGREGFAAPLPPPFQRPTVNAPADAQWTHDLHETVAEPEVPTPKTQSERNPAAMEPRNLPPTAWAAASSAPKPQSPPRSFSRTVHTGNVQLRVFLPGMKAPILFSAVPVKQHTRLPNHRPPLRRDKPVRISLPEQPPRYIFPSTDRSFIFIPRALRPNQQGFGRGRGRAFGSFGGISSRRTSVYGGSVYSPSVALSRRSSLAREVTREGLVSPVGSITFRPPVVPVESSKPIVRLPSARQYPPIPSPAQGPGVLPATIDPQFQQHPSPALRENWASPITMHQPRPQKAVSVAGIESPASLTVQPPPQQEQQPFHHQLPTQSNGTPSLPPIEPALYGQHGRQLSFPAQGTPLQNIPERAVHAQSFQPLPYAPQPLYYPQGFPAGVPAGYYQPTPPAGHPSYSSSLAPGVMAPVFVPAPQPMIPTLPIVAHPTVAPPQSGTVAHESNGMVYYYDASQMYQQPHEGLDPTAMGYVPQYAMPGMGGMMTPSPDTGYYYAQGIPEGAYYPPQ